MELWLSNLWKSSTKNLDTDPVIGILTFEVANLMLKVIHLWNCVSDKKIVQLREEVINSIGVQKLVSNNKDYLMDLVRNEILDCFQNLTKSLARLGKKCTNPIYHNLEHVFDDPTEIDKKWFGFEYKSNKMSKKVKKMKRFVAVTSQLHQELQVLAELRQILTTMKANIACDEMKLFEFQKKVTWQRLEVKRLREMSLWITTYDYTVRILLRSLLAIFKRIKYVFGAGDFYTIVTKKTSDKKLKSRVMPFKGCMMGTGTGPTGSPTHMKTGCTRLSRTGSTLSQAGLSLHYANIIISIEKLSSSPHSISLDARDDLYKKLPLSIRFSMRGKLKLHAKSFGDSANDTILVSEWSLKVARILVWLAPLARNTMRWHSERNFEMNRLVSRLNIFRVQTLFFANREKTEAAITELLIGLSYISSFGKKKL